MSDEPIRRPANTAEVAFLRSGGCTCPEPQVEMTPHEPADGEDEDLFPGVAMFSISGDGYGEIVQRPVVVWDIEFIHENLCPVILRNAVPWN